MAVINEFKELALLIKKSRKDQKLTQTQLAIVCGVGLRFILDVEKGKSTCQIGKVLHLIRMLGLDLVIRKRGEK